MKWKGHAWWAVMPVLVAGSMLTAGGDAAAGVRAAAAHRLAPDAASDFSITIDLSDRALYVMRDGEKIHEYSVAVGQPDYPTPTGHFSVGRIVWNPHWVPPDSDWARDREPAGPGDADNPMGRVKIFFDSPAYYIHGTRDTDSLGEAESHGCVRMRNSEAIALARMVMAHGGEARSPNWFRRVLNRVSSTREVRLSQPVPVRIRA